MFGKCFIGDPPFYIADYANIATFISTIGQMFDCWISPFNITKHGKPKFYSDSWSTSDFLPSFRKRRPQSCGLILELEFFFLSPKICSSHVYDPPQFDTGNICDHLKCIQILCIDCCHKLGLLGDDILVH